MQIHMQLMHISSRKLWLTRHGESEMQLRGHVGAQTGELTATGKAYAAKLAAFIADIQAEMVADDDTSDAADNYDVLTHFFRAFPEFRAVDFFITGESYAGIYIPLLMDQIDRRGGIDNLVGAAIGNGCTGTEAGACAFGSAERTEAVAAFYAFLG